MKEDYQKAFKKSTLFFFPTQSLLMDKVIKKKRGLKLVTSCSSGYQTSSEKFLYQFHIIWPSLLMKYKWGNTNDKVFELFQKLHLEIYESQFMTSWIIPLPSVLLCLESAERKGKFTKLLTSRERKELFRWNKKHFS